MDGRSPDETFVDVIMVIAGIAKKDKGSFCRRGPRRVSTCLFGICIRQEKIFCEMASSNHVAALISNHIKSKLILMGTKSIQIPPIFILSSNESFCKHYSDLGKIISVGS